MAAIVNGALLLRGLVHRGVYQPGRQTLKTLLQSCLGVVAMVLVLWALLPADQFWLEVSMIEKWLRLLLLCVAGAASYFGVALLSGLRPSSLRHTLD